MKTRLIVIVLVCSIAGLLGWYFYQPAAATAAKPAAAPAPATAAAPKPAVVELPVAPAKPAQVAKPVVAAAKVDANAPLTEPAPELTPQSDLNAVMTQSISLLQNHDISGLIKILMPPAQIQTLMQRMNVSSPEELAVAVQQRMPGIQKRADDMLQAMQSVQGLTPELSADGNTATYKLDPPIGDNRDLTFVKVDGNWYLR